MKTTFECKGCEQNHQLECMECGLQTNTECECIAQEEVDQYYAYLCHDCDGVTEFDMFALADGINTSYFYEEMAEYVDLISSEVIDDEEEGDDMGLIGDLIGMGKKNKKGKIKPPKIYDVDLSEEGALDWTYFEDDTGQAWRRKTTVYSKCRHYNHPVEFPDGTMLYPSSCTSREGNEARPDFGLYLDRCWSPTGLAGFIDWPDYSIPTHLNAGALSIIDAYKKAKEGLWVEVGCIGGHGRTGTVLACMAVLAGVPSADAVKWVKKNYCAHAVESKDQEWYVEFFNVFVNGGSIQGLPEKIWSKKKSYVVEGRLYQFPDRKMDWENIDFLRDVAAHQPPKALLKPEHYLHIKTSESTTKERIRIVNSSSKPNANDPQLPF